jgi:hypothetical protein
MVHVVLVWPGRHCGEGLESPRDVCVLYIAGDGDADGKMAALQRLKDKLPKNDFSQDLMVGEGGRSLFPQACQVT